MNGSIGSEKALPVVDDRERFLRTHHVLRANFFGDFIKWLVFQDRIHPLNRADASLSTRCNERRFEPLDIKLGEFAIAVVGQEGIAQQYTPQLLSFQCCTLDPYLPLAP